ncbi:MAG: gldC [Chitinophagaceae bacterium]|nr:gldC [Chitinophagaceae bacterium]
MQTSTIKIDVHLDQNKVPEQINWTASDSTIENMQRAKAFMLAFWDGNEKAALRIDLWTKDMMIDEMGDFFYQTLMTMADTFGRATQNEERVKEFKQFAKDFYNKFREDQLKENKVD